jgi:hypothetical protein
VKQLLGHAQIKMTQRYAHLRQDTLLAAANSATVALGAAMMPSVQPLALAAYGEARANLTYQSKLQIILILV